MCRTVCKWLLSGKPGRALSAVTTLLLMLSGARTTGQPLSWRTEKTHRVAQVTPAASARQGFTLLTPEQTLIRFTNQLSYDRSQANQNLLNGAGVAAGDFDGDGWCDLYFCNLEGSNALFRNLGHWQFTNVTASAGVGCEHQTSRGAVFADVNGDGQLDLLVSSLSGPNCLYLNLGQGRFTNATVSAGLVSKPVGGHSFALADIDGDGDLDIYLANYGENSILRSGGAVSVRPVNGKQVIRGKQAHRLKIVDDLIIEYGEPHMLYVNNGRGEFTVASWTDGTFLDEAGKPLAAAPADMGLSAMFRDINGDGTPDLYVCNDFQTPDRIWINTGQGRFRALAPLAIRSTPHFSMGVDFADIDRDGDDDFFVGDMLSRSHRLRMRQVGATNPPVSHVEQAIDREQFRRNGLFLNRGDQTYGEIANFAGVDASDWSWSVVFLDVDLDGYEDLLIANGHAYDTQDLDMDEKRPVEDRARGAMRTGKNLKDFPPLLTPNVAFRNRGDRTFEELGKKWGFDSDQVSHGIALGDLDNDGDLDMAVSCLWKSPLIYRNDGSAPRVAVRLRGQAPNTQGVGAKIRVLDGPVEQSQEMISGGRYLAADAATRTFAAGAVTNHLRIEVTWRNGRRSVLTNVTANAVYEIFEATSTPSETPPAAPLPSPMFEDVSSTLGFRHDEAAFDDFERQPLLHKQLSRLGPGIGWIDLDGDGDDELIIPGGRTGMTGVYRFDQKEGFKRWVDKIWPVISKNDLTTPVLWIGPGGTRNLIIGAANYEQPEAASPGLVRLEIKNGTVQQLPPVSFAANAASSVGPLAVADVDGDEDLDVFVGGRVVSGRYPEAAASFLLRNNAGVLEPDAAQNRLLQKVGLVSGAVFSDLNGDGLPELIMACEWGPLRVWQNQAGKLSENTEAFGLAPFVGWWNGVTTGDVNGDGKLDIIASNWGWNSSYHGKPDEKPQIFYGDLDSNGSMDLVEAYLPGGGKSIAPRRDMRFMSRGLPLVRTRFASHQAYAEADLAAAVGTPLDKLARVSATTLASVCFLNQGDRFEAVALPDEAQFAPAFGVNVADFDGNGTEDVFLAQNFFAMRAEEPRLDAGRGLLLRGLGTGRFEAVPGQASGITVYGDQRGSAAGDFNRDGRVDLAVGQNRGSVVLLRNSGARPGLRVRLVGPPGNPDGIGAVVRLRFAHGYGPAREIHGGAGYWSHDSVVPVLGMPQLPEEVWVRWPGGKVTTNAVPPEAREIKVAKKESARE